MGRYYKLSRKLIEIEEKKILEEARSIEECKSIELTDEGTRFKVEAEDHDYEIVMPKIVNICARVATFDNPDNPNLTFSFDSFAFED